MVNVNGGFAYIDMSAYGILVIDAEPIEIVFTGDDARKLIQTDKPLVVCNFTYKTSNDVEYTYAPFIGVKECSTEDGETTCNITFAESHSKNAFTIQFNWSSEGATVALISWS